MNSINFWLLIFSTATFLFFVKLVNLLIPGRHYFSFTHFLLEHTQADRHWDLIIKLALPLLFSLLLSITIFWIHAQAGETASYKSRFHHLLKYQLCPTLSTAAALTALLLAWPYILLWDILVDPRHNEQRLLFYLSYLAYVVAYYFLAKAGFQIAATLTQPIQLSWPHRLKEIKSNPLYRPLEAIVTGIVSGVISIAISRIIL